MIGVLICLSMLAAQGPPEHGRSQHETKKEDTVKSLVHEIAASGRILVLVESPSAQVSPRREIAPGSPPLLAFRYLERGDRHRFGQLGLIIDDAGH